MTPGVTVLLGACALVGLGLTSAMVSEAVVRLAAALYSRSGEEREHKTEEWIRVIEDLSPAERPIHAGGLLWSGLRTRAVRQASCELAAWRTDLAQRGGWALVPPWGASLVVAWRRVIRAAAESSESLRAFERRVFFTAAMSVTVAVGATTAGTWLGENVGGAAWPDYMLSALVVVLSLVLRARHRRRRAQPA